MECAQCGKDIANDPNAKPESQHMQYRYTLLNGVPLDGNLVFCSLECAHAYALAKQER